jgi:hypothetical protein
VELGPGGHLLFREVILQRYLESCTLLFFSEEVHGLVSLLDCAGAVPPDPVAPDHQQAPDDARRQNPTPFDRLPLVPAAVPA